MALIKTIRGFTPQFGKDCFFAENATLIGHLIVGDQCSFWFQSIVRGDVNSIHIGNKVNVQDGAIIHCTHEKAATTIGNHVSIGHRAVVHGCTIRDNVLVGMGAVVMDNAVVESNCLIAAGAVVLERAHLKSGWIYAGVPAQPIKKLSSEQLKNAVERTANAYVTYSRWYI